MRDNMNNTVARVGWIKQNIREHWVEYAGAVFVLYMLLFAFPALFDWSAQSGMDRLVLEPFER